MTGESADPADALVARAIESVLEAVPTVPDDEATTDLTKYQPWADTAAPTGKNKRPLEALLDELRERVEAEPDAVAAHPGGRRPAVAYFDRFGSPRREGDGSTPGGGKRRRRGRGGGGGQRGDQGAQTTSAPPSAAAAPSAQGQASGGDGGRRRRRRRSGRGRSGGGSPPGGD